MNTTITYLIGFLIFFFVSCSKQNTSEEKNVVASVGNESITLKEFENSLLLNPQYSIRTTVNTAYHSQINYLIDNEHYYLAANQAKLSEDPLISKRLEYIKNQEILRAYINLEFVNEINISQSELIEGLKKIRTQINAQNFFFSNPDSAETFRRQINNHKDEIRLNKTSTGTNLGWVTFGDLEEKIENKLFLLNKNEVSKVVESKFGYHILIANNIRINEDIKSIPIPTLKQNINEIIKKRKVNKKIEKKINKIVKNKKIKINNRIIFTLSNYINNLFESRNQNPTILIPPIQNKELENIESNFEYILDKDIAIFGDQKWKTSDLLNRLKEMPPFHRPYLATRSRLAQSIIDLFKNDLLVKEAISEGYDENDEAILNYKKYSKEYLAKNFKSLYQSKDLQLTNPKKYTLLKESIENVRENFKPEIDLDKLFINISNPDSVIVEAPIPMMLKNKYEW